MKRLTVLIAALMVAACTNTTDKTLTDQVCIRSHVEMVGAISNSCGQGCAFTTPIYGDVCDEHINIVRANPDYQSTSR